MRQELSDHIVEGPAERYRLDWPGKREAILTANAPIAKTLRPCREESVDFDTTKNLFIEGDNLDALKLLQETYLGKVKLIYIDPPYNTGNDFIYQDDFGEDSEAYLLKSNQSDESKNRLVANSDSNGRFHSAWLTMLYPRLRLARNLLATDGAIFVSIADQEVHNLRTVLNEIFGAENFIASIIWQKVFSPKNSARHFSEDHDYILVFARDAETWKPKLLPRTEEMDSRYSNPDDDPRGPWTSGDLSARNFYSEGLYAVTCPSGRVIDGPPPGRYWTISRKNFSEYDADRRIWWGADGNGMPRLKRFLSDVRAGIVPQTFWSHTEVGHTQEAKKELLSLVEFPDPNSTFDTPKPTRLLRKILQIATDVDREQIVMDFFGGSGSFFEAAIRQNAEDGGNRRAILVQIDEALPSAAGSDRTLKTISDVSRARIKRAGKEVQQRLGRTGDIGFRSLKIDTSNMQNVYYTPDETSQATLLDHVNNIKPDRTPEDLLFQVLLDWGVDLACPIASETIDGKQVFFVDGNALAACFDTGLTDEFVQKIAERKPLRAVFRDASYASDAAKINVEQIFKFYSPDTELKCL